MQDEEGVWARGVGVAGRREMGESPRKTGQIGNRLRITGAMFPTAGDGTRKSGKGGDRNKP